jgi:hypothetical protein
MTTEKAKILLLAANPLDTTPLQLDEEARAIDAALRMAQLRDQVELVTHWAVRVDDVAERLLRHRPVILHFSGHGSPNEQIILTTAAGASIAVEEHAFAELVRLAAKTVQCVFLNACYSEAQARLMARHLPAAIGTSIAIGDQAAIHFAKAFYLAFASGESIAAAFQLAQAELKMTDPDQAQHVHLLEGAARASFHLTAPGTAAETGAEAAPEAQTGAATIIRDSTIKGMVQVNHGSVSITFNEAAEPPDAA